MGESKTESALRPATRGWRDNELSGEDEFVVRADHIPRPGLENGIVEISHALGRLPSGHPELVIRNVRTGGVLLHRAGTARRWDEQAVICVPSDVWIGREIGWCALSHRRKAQADHVNRAGENTSCEVSCMREHRNLLCDTASQDRKINYIDITTIGTFAASLRAIWSSWRDFWLAGFTATLRKLVRSIPGEIRSAPPALRPNKAKPGARCLISAASGPDGFRCIAGKWGGAQ
jgi:hypothetical protein